MDFRKKIAIDLGTASVLVYVKNKGVILNEPSVVAMNSYDNRIVSVGKEAKKMLGRTPGNIVAKRPLKDGVIADFDSTEKMLSYFIKKATGRSLIRPEVIICIPSAITEVQRRAVLQAAKYAGAYKTYLIEEPLAAAIGTGIDLSDASGNIIVDIGGGTTDVAVISMGGIVINKSIPIAGDNFDKEIQEYVKKKYNMLIGERTAENIKINIGNVYPVDEDEFFEVKGRNLLNGLPMHIYITSEDVSIAIKDIVEQIVATIAEVLESTPPELAADIFEKGIILSGGGSLLKGLEKKITKEIGITASLCKGPVSAVVRGTGKSLSSIERFKVSEDQKNEMRRKVILNQARKV